MPSELKTAAELAMGNNGHSQVRFRAATPAYDMVDTRLSYGWANTLIKAATPEDSRINPALVDYDFHRTITSIGRRTLYSLARVMFWQIPPLQAAILEQATLTACPFLPRYVGKNTTWGEQASEWLDQWHQVMCVEGWPYDYHSFCEILVGESIVDGEIHTLLTEDGSANARVQFIPAHRIGSRYQTGGVCKVTYDGNRLFIDDQLIDGSLPYEFKQKVEWRAPIIDGVIVDAQARPIAYRVYEDPAVSGRSRDLSARSCFPSFFPIVAGQLHGISLLASSVYDWQDWREFKSFEQLAQKVFSSRTIVETNETGEADAAKALIRTPAAFDSNGNQTELPSQALTPGGYNYLKAKAGTSLAAFDWHDRPGRNAQDWQEMTVRDAMRGTEWDAFFSLDPKSVGGAPMRVVVDRINRVVRKRRRLLSKNLHRVDVFALAKAISNGDLPFDADWFRWAYQGPPDVTADRRYDSQTDEMEWIRGWKSLDQVVEARGDGDWRRLREQKEREADDLYERAKRLADKFEISIQEAANRLELVGNQAFNMARRDTGGDALGTDEEHNPVDQTPNEEKGPANKGAAPKAELAISIDDKRGRKKKRLIKLLRDPSSGRPIGAEVEEEE